MVVGSSPTFGKVKTFILTANMPEWSKGGDLRSPVFVRVGSNPTVGKVKTFILSVNMPEWSKGDDLRSSGYAAWVRTPLQTFFIRGRF